MSLSEHETLARETRRLNSAAPFAVPGIEEFAGWLEDELENLEARFRSFWTRQSLVIVLMAVCYSRGE